VLQLVREPAGFGTLVIQSSHQSYKKRAAPRGGSPRQLQRAHAWHFVQHAPVPWRSRSSHPCEAHGTVNLIIGIVKAVLRDSSTCQLPDGRKKRRRSHWETAS
jgi:hypothetical protein